MGTLEKFPFKPTPEVEERSTGRIRCEQFTCNMGRVLDLSGGGMRVDRRGIPIPTGREVLVRFRSETKTITVAAKVAHSHSTGFLHQIVGLEFVGVDEKLHKELTDLSRDAFDRRTLV